MYTALHTKRMLEKAKLLIQQPLLATASNGTHLGFHFVQWNAQERCLSNSLETNKWVPDTRSNKENFGN